MKILVIGDSHSKYFNITPELRDCSPNTRGLSIRVIPISGATITGFGRRSSSLDSYGTLVSQIEEFSPDHVCFAFGQVDIELGYYYRKVFKDDTVNYTDFIQDLVKNYINRTLDFVESHPKMSITFKGINLSTLTESRNKAINYTSRIISENISDQEQKKYASQKLKALLASNLERNAAHLYFNQTLEKECENYNFGYFDVVSETSDLTSLTVNKFHIPSTDDHHLVDSLYIREIHIQKLVSSLVRKR
ncbi:MAG: hypothetical protein CMB97_08430 [Flavobacteriaceae bacterium]|nr:hypothetical protein [Flavobacteriaceae bacterium]